MDKIKALRPSLENEIKRKNRVMVMNSQEFAESRNMLLKRSDWLIL